MRKLILALSIAGAVVAGSAAAQTAPDRRAILVTYADIAAAMYGDALIEARKLQRAVEALVATPSEAAMKAARTAWLAARIPYQQTEVYRFANPVVDAWEGRVNAWPLDEGLIDYVDPGYGAASEENPLRTANVIANTAIKLGGKTLDTRTISWRLLRSLQEAGGIEANVATGYHAIEFLLWGQDLNGTGPGAGNRPWTDYAKGAACTGGNCDRRAQYLKVATQLLVDDLAWMAKAWAAGGEARQPLVDGEPDAGISAMVTGLGSLAYGELAGERMKLGLMLHDPEEEHDCFSDNTHNSHYYDVAGMRAVYAGSYTRLDGRKVAGPGLGALIAATDAALGADLQAKLDKTEAAMRTVKTRAETKEAYDQMIGPENPEGNVVVQAAIDTLTEQTRSLERAVAALKLKAIKFEGSDSLDDPAKVFK
ncbi:imelysin family protein [Desertibaculum subflavum]|uniref:imelysin family protein n=1 Tax=Desertibaculum subflavum TaxID=2268458 RepID=UPI000E670C68